MESNLGFAGAKEGCLGDNKYLNNLKDIKGSDKNNALKHGGESMIQPQFDLFQPPANLGAKSRFAKNLFADFNNNALLSGDNGERGLFQIPEKNFESEFGLETKNGLDLDQNIDFEIENNNFHINKLLDFESENSHDFELEEPRNNLAGVFNSGEKDLSPKREVHFQTPTKNIIFEDKRSSSKNNLFSTITAKKTTPISNHFSDFMNSTNVTDPSTTDFLSTRKGELTTSSRKEHRFKHRTSYSRFENDYEILETLGSGDFGTVFKCQHKLDGLIYAIKRIHNKSKGKIGIISENTHNY